MKHLFLWLLVILSSILSAQSFQFFKENLKFEISDSLFTVDGLYYFKNDSKDTIRQYMLYPFPVNPLLGQIENVDGISQYPKTDFPLIANFDQKAARFKLFILPFDTAVARIVYSQQVPNNIAEYLLTSTKAWNKPLENADFTLKLPFHFRIDSLSYNADSLLFSEDHLLYKFHFSDFMPDRNFYVSFSGIE